jgi:hypothetical protein
MDIRNPNLRERKIKSIYPKIFFKTCKVCGYDFRKTVMWSWIDSWGWEGEPCRAFACTGCVPDYKDLFQHIYGYNPLVEEGRG